MIFVIKITTSVQTFSIKNIQVSPRFAPYFTTLKLNNSG
jgi:hypothetical protein